MNNNLIQKIKSYDIVEILKNYVQLSRKGNNYLAICPFHNDTKPSLTINSTKNIFKCFSCGISGDVIKFVMQYKNISYYSAILDIANVLNISQDEINSFSSNYKENSHIKEYELNEQYFDFCQMFLFNNENIHALNYLLNRKIDKEIIEKFKIGFNPNKSGSDLYNLLTNEENNYINLDEKIKYTRNDLLNNNLINITSNGNILDTFRNRIIFSICNSDGQIVGFSGRSIDNENQPKYLNTTETTIFKKSKNLYNFHNILKSDFHTLYIVEGFMDVIALFHASILNSVATMGTALTDDHIKMILDYKKIKTIILAFDNDEAGYQATITNGRKIAKYFDVYVISKYDQQYKDLDEAFVKNDEKFIKEIVDNNIHFSLFLLKDLIQKYSFPLSESNKNIFFKDSMEIIKNYGSKFLIDKYIEFLSLNTNYDKNIIQTEIDLSLKNANFNKRPKYQVFNKIKKTINFYNVDVAKKMYERIIIACLTNREALEFVKNNFPLKTLTELFKTHYDFITKLNMIIKYYDNNEQFNSCYEDINNFLLFAKNNCSSNNTRYYLEQFYDHFKNIKNNNFYNFTYENIINTINQAYISELEIRISYAKEQLTKYNYKYTSDELKELQNSINQNSKLIQKYKK